ncbi:MAG: XRE family transcriptional regulator [Alphaproteobacteria bacterium]|nr:XRE family transcriptional regulator [Alphaproteobacteria bacterium]
MAITTAQIRGARGILNWSQSDLAQRTGISATSIGSIEKGQSQPRESTVQAIQHAFESGGIEFLGREGVRIKTGEIQTFRGKVGFWEFYEDIYRTCLNEPLPVLVSNVDEREFMKWLSEENVAIHVDRMKKIEGLRYKIAIKEGDTYYLASSKYAEYRWMPREYFSSVPFYAYGKKLAILLFNAEPTVILLNYPAVAEAYRSQFDAIWDTFKIPPTDKQESV